MNANVTALAGALRGVPVEEPTPIPTEDPTTQALRHLFSRVLAAEGRIAVLEAKLEAPIDFEEVDDEHETETAPAGSPAPLDHSGAAAGV